MMNNNLFDRQGSYLRKVYDKNHSFFDICLILFFWVALFFLGYPDPMIDDLFFIGAGINLAKGGDFVNPLLLSWNNAFESGQYYYHFPYYSWIIAFWIKMFGLSSKSLSSFQVFNSIIFSINCLLILRLMKFKKYIYPFIVVLFAFWMNTLGLRPDCIGMALLSLGLLLLTQNRNKNLCSFFAFFFIIASFLSSTAVLLTYGISFSIGILLIQYIQEKSSQENIINDLRKKFVLLSSAIALNGFIFLSLIKFDFNPWLIDFLHHASLRRVPMSNSFPHFFSLITFGWNPLILLPSYILFFVLFLSYLFLFKKHKANFIIFLLSLILGVLLNIIIYSSSTGFINFLILIGVLVTATEIPLKSYWKKYIFLFCLVIVVSSQSLKIIYLTHRNYPLPTYFEEIQTQVNQIPKSKRYVIDSIAARFIFDYNLPENSISFDFIGVNRYPLKSDKKDDDIWVVSRPNLGQIKGLDISYPKIYFWEREFNSLPKEPFDILIFR